jgi:hypothetical protein
MRQKRHLRGVLFAVGDGRGLPTESWPSSLPEMRTGVYARRATPRPRLYAASAQIGRSGRDCDADDAVLYPP